jgi:hypothetical protein
MDQRRISDIICRSDCQALPLLLLLLLVASGRQLAKNVVHAGNDGEAPMPPFCMLLSPQLGRP